MEDPSCEQVYQEPAWATAPPHGDWVLIEVKNGVEIATHSLSTNCITFGRTDDCSIPLLHGSISRLHARIAFDSAGWPWLKDLQSTHGVSVNKKPLPKSSISRVESTSTNAGARGVRIFPGDVIQFGASTRIYCLQGPLEFERNKLVQLPKEVKLGGPQVSKAAEQQTPIPPPDGKLADNLIPPSHRKQWENLQALRYKIENLERESSRINAKANTQELSDGQTRQLETNEGKLDQLRGRAETVEEEIKRVVFGQTRGENPPRKQHSYHQGEEEVFDRTKDGKESDLAGSEHPQTEEGLKSLWVSLCQEMGRTTSAVERYSNSAKKLQNSLDVASEDDTFFLSNELALNQDNLVRAKEKIGTLETQISEAEKLLRVINAKLVFMREKCLVLNDTTMFPASQAPGERQLIASKGRRLVPQFSIATAKPIVVPQKQTPQQKVPEFEAVLPMKTERTTTLLPPPPKRTKATLPPPQFEQATPILPPPSRTAAPRKPDVSTLEQEHDNWQAPADQDGSGRTKLNNKFAGRY